MWMILFLHSCNMFKFGFSDVSINLFNHFYYYFVYLQQVSQQTQTTKAVKLSLTKCVWHLKIELDRILSEPKRIDGVMLQLTLLKVRIKPIILTYKESKMWDCFHIQKAGFIFGERILHLKTSDHIHFLTPME